ncbi:MAG: response regulator [Lachnospiraceae bacterium]|nr:response regulator [Lachnospiraceae bacterium]
MVKWIFLVDSDTVSLKNIGRILSKGNMRVTAFNTGEALLNYLNVNHSPDMIIIDSEITGIGCGETIKTLRQPEFLKNFGDVPIVQLKSKTSRDDEIRFGELGVVGCLNKGAESDEMLNKINLIFEEHKAIKDVVFSLKSESEENPSEEIISLSRFSDILREKEVTNNALLLNKDEFVHVYRFIMRYIKRYNKNACNLFFTISNPLPENSDKFDLIKDEFLNHVIHMLRKSDIITKPTDNQIMVLLTDIKEVFVDQVIGSILRTWYSKNGNIVSISYEVHFESFSDSEYGKNDRLKVIIVDDDFMNLKMASFILEKNGIEVISMKSGQELLNRIKDYKPDLILLDVNMPEMDGFETLERLRAQEESSLEIPIIFLTADDSNETETKGLALGAMDFIKKPFVPDVLILRVRHTVALTRLQMNLEQEVDRKKKEIESLFMHVVQSLADAIDAKDTYTNGHSDRVARYCREIAKRYGYSAAEQDNIYMMGLLHDVGKIGVPDAVINKPAKLTDAEFDLIKNHPVMGARILKNIKELPKLATGARWHHEKYGGGGYPDGLNGTDIPEEARIIAVADAYDAMTSRRSYREPLSQESVRKEIERGIGVQFDPDFARIMLEMIDEDVNYNMREM